MIKSTHTFQVKNINVTSLVIEGKEQGEKLHVDEGHCYVERITTASRKRLVAWDPRYKTTMDEFQYDVFETKEDLEAQTLDVKGEPQETFRVRPELSNQILNAPTGVERQLEFMGKMMARGLCERLFPQISHDIVMYDFDPATGTFQDIQPLIFILSNTEDSITVNIQNAETPENVEVKLDKGDWQSELTFSSLAQGEYTVYVKERESIILSQKITI